MPQKLVDFYEALDLKGTTMAHWGIKGMRWGIRRSDAELARASGESDDAARAAATQKSIQTSGSLSSVSDSDLNHLVNRLNVEARYTTAISNPSVASKGHNAIKTVLGAGDTMNKAISFANSPAGKLLYSSLKLSKSAGRHARR